MAINFKLSDVVAVAEITGVETLPWEKPNGRRHKQAVIGRALGPGHPAYEYFIDRPIAAARNPVSYIDDPQPRPAPEPRSCACGCGAPVEPPKHFVPGHDQRAVHERIASQWGDTLGFIRWFDETYGGKAGGPTPSRPSSPPPGPAPRRSRSAPATCSAAFAKRRLKPR